MKERVHTRTPLVSDGMPASGSCEEGGVMLGEMNSQEGEEKDAYYPSNKEIKTG